MKQVVIVFVTFILLGSCNSFHQGNFNKRKYLHLHAKSQFDDNEQTSSEVFNENENGNDAKTASDEQIISRAELSCNVSVKIDIEQGSAAETETPLSETPTVNKHIPVTVVKAKNKSSKEKNRAAHASTFRVNGWLYFLLFIPLLFALKNDRKGRKISEWASRNKTKSKILITFFGLIGLGSSFALGNMFHPFIDDAMIVTSASFAVSSIVITGFKLQRKKRRMRDLFSRLLFNVSLFFGAFLTGSKATALLPGVDEVDPESTIMNPVLGAFLGLLIVCLLIIAVFFLYLFTCQLVCSGSIALAGIVLFGGIYFVFFLAILGFMEIGRKWKDADTLFAGKAALYALLSLPLTGLIFWYLIKTFT